MKKYNMPIERLVRYFKEGRAKWKAVALERQTKIRALNVKVRDVINSRDMWKQRAKEAEEELKKKLIQSPNSSISQENNEIGEVVIEGELLTKESLNAPKNHTYPLFVMRMAIESVINVLTGFRGGYRNLELISEVITLPIPSMSSIRYWVYRLGFHLLQQKPSYYGEWIIITDITATLGKLKCLLVIGIPKSSLRDGIIKLPLNHHDVEILGLEILSQSTGEIIAEKLEQISERIGTISQVIADHGSDIKKGIELFQEKHPETINTYDLSHQIALFLKALLSNDEKYNEFSTQCGNTLKSIQQTELFFLKPNNQRTKSRWLNIDILINWAQSILAYELKGDFSQISEHYSINAQAILAFEKILPNSLSLSLTVLLNKVYLTPFSFYRAIIKVIGLDELKMYRRELLEAASIGRQRFQEKLGWISDYKKEITIYSQMMNIVQIASEQIKHEGLHEYSIDYFKDSTNSLVLTSMTHSLKDKIIDYMSNELEHIKDKENNSTVSNDAIPASSDIIESLFGKYKQFLMTSPLNEVSKMVLILPLLVVDITNDLIKDAMENVKTKDLEKWADEVFGISSLAKRRQALGST